MEKWPTYFRQALTKEAIKAQFKRGSALSRLFMFSLISAVTLGILGGFVQQYLTGTRAGAAQPITISTSASKDKVAVNEDFTVNFLMSAPTGQKISQVNLVVNVAMTADNDVKYIPGTFEAAPVGGAAGYFEDVIVENYDAPAGTPKASAVRLALSTRKDIPQLSDKVVVKMKFKAMANGSVTFTLSGDSSEIIGPAAVSTDATIYTFATGSTVATTVQIGEGPTATPAPVTNTPIPSATNVPLSPSPTLPPNVTPTPTITIAPAPSCRSNDAASFMAGCKIDTTNISMLFVESSRA